MAVAGFYPIHNSEIRFAADGYWYADGERIVNKKIARLFAGSIGRAADGGYELRVGDERASILVDDTPYVVTAVKVNDELVVDLNDGSTETVAPDRIEVGDANVFYCPVKEGRERARLLRAAHYQLAEHIQESPSGGFQLELGTRVYPIRTV